METHDGYVRVELKRSQLSVALAAGLIGLGAYTLDSETLTMSTTYPSPTGIYQKFISTDQTTLARDRGTVTLGPAASVDRTGHVAAVSVGASGAVTAGTLATSGAATIGGSASIAGSETIGSNVTVNGARTYLVGRDGGNNHWLMGGGATEGVNNALGFNMGSRTINVGPGWTFTAAPPVKAWSGVFSGSGWAGSMFVPLGFQPVAASCAAAQIGRAGSWCQPFCWYSFGPNYVVFNIGWYQTGCCQGFCGVPGWMYDVMVVGQ